MSESADDTSKKERLINAWLAAGPDGKTTDVSDVTDSSRGYASDIRRALESDDDEDGLSIEAIREAHDPSLVASYREQLGEDALTGEWPFVDELTEPEEPSEPEPEEAAPARASESTTEREQPTPASPETTTQPSPPEQPEAHKPIPGPQSSGQTQRSPPDRSRQGPTHPSPGPTTPSQSSAPPSQTHPPQATQPPQQRPPRSSGPQQHRPGPQPGPATTPTDQPSHRQGGQRPQQPQHRHPEQHPTQSRESGGQGLYSELASLDNALATAQQRAERDVQSLPPNSQAQSVAISKHNLIVDVRESLSDIAARFTRR